MRLYLFYLPGDLCGYDAIDGMVVAADNDDDARMIAFKDRPWPGNQTDGEEYIGNDKYHGGWPNGSKGVIMRMIGTADPGVERGVIFVSVLEG